MIDALRRITPTIDTPSDWVYVYNFEHGDRPNAIRLPAGRGRQLAHEMTEFVQAAQREILRAFESEDYERHQHTLATEIAERRKPLFQELTAFAKEKNYAVEMTPSGVMSIPIINGQPIPGEMYAMLPEQQRDEIEERGAAVRQQVAKTMRQVWLIEKEATERLRVLDHQMTVAAIDPLLVSLKDENENQPEVLTYLSSVRDDIVAHYQMFRSAGSGSAIEGESPAATIANLQTMGRSDFMARYEVNVLIDNSSGRGAPVIIERNPTYYNLIGRMDYHALFGALVTDFRQIKPGALHRANGGFLILHASEILRQPFAWEALKRALLYHEARIENLSEYVSPAPTATLRPEPIRLDLKVVLVGSSMLYRLLYALDEDFPELFKVKADFAPDIPWTDEHVQDFAAFVSRRVRDLGLSHFDRGAVARLIEHAARLRQHQRKLSARLSIIADIVSEAGYWAGDGGHDVVLATDVDQAIRAKEHRANLVTEQLEELIEDGTLAIETNGERVGQVNGIAVIDLGDYAFGRPSRISARVALGDGTLQSIEREIKLSGPIHAKGFLILGGYLAGQYGQELPLAIGATITFEQSYDEIDGDSASSTELYVLLSALAGLPLRQGIAVTGSVNQYGDVQAVGGVTQKIEGFFAVCKARGLTGDQGVIIPATNVQNLMLKDDVVAAVRAGEFHVWAVRTIDEGIELLTGRPAGQRDEHGQFPEGCVHRLVEERLRRYAEGMRSFTTHNGVARRPRKTSRS
ncbi:MAG: ATP-binding protein [Thermomicrobiales bacterium]